MLWSLVAAMVAVRIVAATIVLIDCVDHPINILGGDARRYLDILHAPGTPYRDVPVEYPPLMLAFTRLIEGPDLLATQVRLVISQLLVELAAAGLLAWAWNKRVAIAFLVLGTPMALYPFAYFRLDLVAVLAAVAAMALVKKARPGWGGAVLGLAGFVKVWPLVLVPWLALRHGWRSRGARRSLAFLVAVVAAGGLAWIVWAGVDGPQQVLSFRGAAGWQIESVMGIFFHIADPASSSIEQGAWRTAADVPQVFRMALPIAALASAASAWALAERARLKGRPDAVALMDGWAPLAAVLGLLVFSSIISPQYMVWLTPFAAIVVVSRTRGSLLAGGLFLCAGGLSALGMASLYSLNAGRPWATSIVVARNSVLVTLLVVCFVVLVRSATSRAGAARQATPKAMMATMSEVDATKSIEDVRSGMP